MREELHAGCVLSLEEKYNAFYQEMLNVIMNLFVPFKVTFVPILLMGIQHIQFTLRICNLKIDCILT